MNHLRAALPFALTLLLAACGGTGPTPTPPIPAPPTTPTPPPTPAPPTTPPVIPPTQPPETPAVLYYGEWAWSFDPSGQYDLEQEGRFSITQTATDIGEDVSIGTYQSCYQGSCNNIPEGAVIIGDFASTVDEGLQIIFFRLDSANDPVLTFTVKDSDGELETDDQGRQVLEGRGQYLDNYDGEKQNGTIRAILIEPAPTFPPLQ